jgi:hypothetical protein
MRRFHDDDYTVRLERERNKRLPPGSRWHQYWCAIFNGKRCDCDEGRPPRPGHRRGQGGGGATVPTKKAKAVEVRKQRALEEA